MAGTNQEYYVNDEVVNKYLQMIALRSEGTIYVYDTFFFDSLITRKYDFVQSFTRRVDIFNMEKLYIPINVKGIHWILIIVDLENKTVEDYDSLGRDNKAYRDAIYDYLKNEHLTRKQKALSLQWTLRMPLSIPLQTNNYDCGIFLCTYAEYVSRNAVLDFSQNNMSTFRNMIAFELEHNIIIEEKLVLEAEYDDWLGTLNLVMRLAPIIS